LGMRMRVKMLKMCREYGASMKVAGECKANHEQKSNQKQTKEITRIVYKDQKSKV
jgi:hypothetical protein